MVLVSALVEWAWMALDHASALVASALVGREVSEVSVVLGSERTERGYPQGAPIALSNGWSCACLSSFALRPGALAASAGVASDAGAGAERPA